jgi:hypothetical protein
VNRSRGTALIALSMPFLLGAFVTFNDRMSPMGRLDIQHITGLFCRIIIPAQVETIDSGSFADLHKLEKVMFEGDISPGGLGGCESCCAVQSIFIPSFVEIIKIDAFQECTLFPSLSFQEPNQIVETHEFSECSFSAFTMSGSVTCIGLHAFVDLHMPFMIFKIASPKNRRLSAPHVERIPISGSTELSPCVPFRFDRVSN